MMGGVTVVVWVIVNISEVFVCVRTPVCGWCDSGSAQASTCSFTLCEAAQTWILVYFLKLALKSGWKLCKHVIMKMSEAEFMSIINCRNVQTRP